MSLRLFVDLPLSPGLELALPEGAARHAQVRRVQSGDRLRLFNDQGQDWLATVLRVGRSEVRVGVGEAHAVDRELARAVTLALGMPANERMDTLVEKAAELGVAAIQPLLCERSVLRLAGDRAERKRAHWQAVAVAACEQCGRALVPQVLPIRTLGAWLAALPAPGADETRLLLSFQPAALPLHDLAGGAGPVLSLSGPEGGLTADEEAAAAAAGFAATELGPRVLRADTAPLAVLALIGLQAPQPRR